jgi:RNA polymerase sigma-70 factor (ECF subfamily)
MSANPALVGVGRALEQFGTSLRACVPLQDVFDDTLEQIAELVNSTVGGVKAAHNRGAIEIGRLP